MTKTSASSAQRNAASIKLGRSALTGAAIAKPVTAGSVSAKRVRKVVRNVVADRAH
jgi:hypothetical protein